MELPKRLPTIFMPVLFSIFTLAIVNLPFGLAQGVTNVSGIISSNTTWAKPNSPYNLVGDVQVSSGVTLTIEGGVIVYFNSYYMNVSGTLSARGSETEKISITGAGVSYLEEWQGRIIFAKSSNNSIIENAEIRSSPNTIIAIYAAGTTTISSSTISGTNGTAIYIEESSPSLIGNTISGNNDGISIDRFCSPIIMGNIINNTHSSIGIFAASPIISGNNITNSDYGIFDSVVTDKDATIISGNTLSDNKDGIHFYFFVRYETHQSVTGNLITGSQTAITIDPMYNWVGTADITGNTVAGNVKGIYVGPNVSPEVKVNQNNIYANGYNIEAASDVDAINNWWGTTDQQAINQSIYDYKNDSNLGNVSFIPFLTAPNPQAPAAPMSIPTVTPSPTAFPTPVPSISEFPALVILTFLSASLLAAFLSREEGRLQSI